MIKTISLFDFRQEFKQCNRSDNFSYEGLEVLFDYLESLEFDRDTPLELDVIEFCCEFSEDTWENIANSYSIILADIIEEDEEVKMERVKEYLEENGAFVGRVAGSFVYRDF
jgi:hypothetical protein